MTPSNLTRVERDEHHRILQAKRFAMEVALRHARHIQRKKEDELANQQIARQRAISLMCRIYVGAIHYEIGESTVKVSFKKKKSRKNYFRCLKSNQNYFQP